MDVNHSRAVGDPEGPCAGMIDGGRKDHDEFLIRD
jgi:hypothetical protein